MDFNEILEMTNKKVKRLDAENRKIIVWGMGHVASLNDNAFKTEQINIYAYTSKEVIGEEGKYGEFPIISPMEISHLENPLILINVKNNIYAQEIIEQIKTINPKADYLLVDEFFFGRRAELIRNNIRILEDEESKRVYAKFIERSIRNERRMYDLYTPDQYWAIPPFRVDDVNEVVVDMGGFVGDTLERYLFARLGSFKKYYVFEPDENNYDALLKRISRLNEEWNLDSDKIIPVFAGVGRENSRCYFAKERGTGAGSHYTERETDIERQIVCLDSYFKDIKVSFLKADIESYELDMLLGAVNILKRDRPKLAISIYHNAVDMYYILNWLNNLGLGYKFFVRHHSVREVDTILYSVCEETDSL